ncbi:MAG: enoyl-CoA hydratase [Proteobacteria bacterium]|nr:enoyl-CoA hydratase [Pseudomonadota bacterium]
MKEFKAILVDDPATFIRRITLNRPEKRNAISNRLRSEVFEALMEADYDPSVRVIVVRGAGKCFCAGYDLGGGLDEDLPWVTAGGDGHWARHVVQGWYRIWDMAKPVIAQVHGYCLAGGSELAAACDLVYVSDDAKIGYPVVRSMSQPDMQYQTWLMGMRNAMELMLTGDSLSGEEAVRVGFANRVFPLSELEEKVLEMAQRVAKIPSDLQQLNKRTVHRAMEIMGIRTAINAGTEIHSLGWYQKSSMEHMAKLAGGGDLKETLSERDGKFGDYRTESTEE